MNAKIGCLSEISFDFYLNRSQAIFDINESNMSSFSRQVVVRARFFIIVSVRRTIVQYI